jgi:2-polyprenyl-6-hydroxyphenyl methylase/3-demethylubiquinone-9 3-methyltransferase
MVAGERFDLVTSMEVIEHVVDPAIFVAGLAAALDEGGLLILSTPNRTLLSRLAIVTVGEGLGMVPRGTHDWSRFLTPEETTGLVEQAGLRVADITGLAFSPARGFHLSDVRTLNYLLTAERGTAEVYPG